MTFWNPSPYFPPPLPPSYQDPWLSLGTENARVILTQEWPPTPHPTPLQLWPSPCREANTLSLRVASVFCIRDGSLHHRAGGGTQTVQDRELSRRGQFYQITAVPGTFSRITYGSTELNWFPNSDGTRDHKVPCYISSNLPYISPSNRRKGRSWFQSLSRIS